MNKLFNIAIIGAGTKGKRLAKKLIKTGKSVVIFDPKTVEITGGTFINKSVIYVQYIRGILGITVEGNTQPEFFCERLILAAPCLKIFPSNFYTLALTGDVVINKNCQLPSVAPLIYVINPKLINYTKNLEVKIIENI